MSNALQVYNDGGFDTMQRAAKAMVASGYFADANDIARAVVKVMAGAELGIPPYASMTGIHVINSKPALGANLIATLIKSSGRYNYRVVEHTDDICKIVFYEYGEQIGESVFTAQDAQRAGTKNMNKFPRNMLFSRAISNGARWHCPDIFGGAPVYTAEELGADIDENGDVLQVTEPPKHHATEYADFVDVETVEPRRIQEQRLDTLPASPQATPVTFTDTNWYHNSPADKGAFVALVMRNVPRYANNSHAAGNAILKVLDGRDFASLDQGNRDQLAHDVLTYAAKRDKEEATPKTTAAQEILKSIDGKELDHMQGGLPHYD